MNENSIIEANDDLNKNEMNRQEENVNTIYKISNDQNDAPCILKMDESEMTFPIRSEEHIIKKTKHVVNGISYFEKKEAIEIYDGKNTAFTIIKVNRKIGKKTYKSVEVIKDKKSEGIQFNLEKVEKEQFESEWDANWNPPDINTQTLKNESQLKPENVIRDFAPADDTPYCNIPIASYENLSDPLKFEGLNATGLYRLVLANRVKLTKDEQGWSTNVQNEQNEVVMKGALETYSPGFLWRSGGIKYDIFVQPDGEKWIRENILKLESGCYLPKDLQSNKNEWAENEMVVSKYDGTNACIPIGRIVANRNGYNVFDMKNEKMFTITKTSNFLTFSPRSKYSVHRLPLKDDKLRYDKKAMDATIEVVKAHYTIPATSTLIDYKSPSMLIRRIDEMGLLLAVLFEMLQKPMFYW